MLNDYFYACCFHFSFLFSLWGLHGKQSLCNVVFSLTFSCSLRRAMAVDLQRPLAAVACLLFLLQCLTGGLSIPDPRQREALIKLETSMQTGGQVVLTDAEQRLDSLLQKMKQQEMMRPDFPPAMHFFKARDLINGSPIFSLLQKMPKGVFNSVLQLPQVSLHKFIISMFH